jgi:protein phosphatase
MMTIRSSGRTDPGKKRDNNEDSFLVNDGLGLFAVADGVGGHAAGEVASRLAVDTLLEVVPGFLAGDDTTPPFTVAAGAEPATAALRYAITLSNRKVIETSAGNPALSGMGTTVTALLLIRDSAHVAHVGDSRAYLFRAGELRQLTADHTLVAEQVRTGVITPAEARASKQRHIITRAIGIEKDVDIDVLTVRVQARDLFLLCTDGLTELVPDDDIARILAASMPDTATQKLIGLANERGGVDNITTVVVAVTGA